jgi:hypothetical protein
MLPHEIGSEPEKRIRAGLLRIEAKRLDRRSRLERAYDVYANELSRAGWPLTETLLTESIPLWVYQWAKPWLPAKCYVPGARVALGGAWVGLPGRGTVPATRPLSEAEIRVWVKGLVATRIKYWQAEALSPQEETGMRRPRAGLEEEARGLAARLREHYTVNGIAVKDVCGVSRSTFLKWWRHPDLVRYESVETIVSCFRRAVKQLPPQSE